MAGMEYNAFQLYGHISNRNNCMLVHHFLSEITAWSFDVNS